MNYEAIALAFQIQGTPVKAQPFGHGHINLTVKLETDTGNQYILQRINRIVFPKPVQLMENAQTVTEYLRQQPGYPCQILRFLPTRTGGLCHLDEAGEYWRMYPFIAGTALDRAENSKAFYRCGQAFGAFQRYLADFPADTLHEIIPNFHNTVDRYRQFRAAVEADPVGRLQEVAQEAGFLLSMSHRAGMLQWMLDHDLLPLRVTHNDTKINNLLFDDAGQPICILDLDTVMPGLSLMDFADAIRTGAATAAEDEPDLAKMSMDLGLFRAFAAGFLEEATTLTPNEVKYLAESVLIITLEQATRFLRDYLEGDPYYKIAYPTHNLVRARAQIMLALDIERKMNDMNQIIHELYKKIRKNTSC